jgi:phosphatidate cytidylyltransferase
MIRRVAVAAVGIPAALALVYVGGWVLAALLAVFGAVGASEFYRLGERAGLRPLRIPGVVGAVALPLVAYASLPAGGALEPGWIAMGGALWLILVVAAATSSRGPADRPLGSVSLTVFGTVYAAGLPAFLLPIRHLAGTMSPAAATALVFLPLVVTWVCDSLAMGGGSLFGGPKLAPVLSPNKTWAGAISGSVGALVLAPLYGILVLTPLGVEHPVWQLAVFGLVISVAGQVGDVSESLFKREVKVKDSGRFFPGHGGVLDRFDSLYWVLPAAVLLLLLFGTI